MTSITWFDDPAPRRSWWSFTLALLGIIEQPRQPIRKHPAPVYQQKFGDVDVRERPRKPTRPIEEVRISSPEQYFKALRLLRHGWRMAA